MRRLIVLAALFVIVSPSASGWNEGTSVTPSLRKTPQAFGIDAFCLQVQAHRSRQLYLWRTRSQDEVRLADRDGPDAGTNLIVAQ